MSVLLVLSRDPPTLPETLPDQPAICSRDSPTVSPPPAADMLAQLATLNSVPGRSARSSSRLHGPSGRSV